MEPKKKDAEDKLKEEENNNSVNGDENKNKIIKNPILRKYYNQLKKQKYDEKMKLIEDNKHLKNKLKNESKENKINIDEFLLKEYAKTKGLQIIYEENTNKKTIIKKMESIADKLLNDNKDLDYNEAINDINAFGKSTKKDLEEDMKKNPGKYIDLSEIKDTDDEQTKILKSIAVNFKKLGAFCAIERKCSNQKILDATLQMITSGMAEQTKYELHFDFGEKENHEILYNKKRQQEFVDEIKGLISTKYAIPKKDIQLLDFRSGSVCCDLFIKKKLLEGLTELKEVLPKITNVYEKILLEGIRLAPEIFDPKGNNSGEGWEKSYFTRGGEKYYPPYGWVGYGLKVWDKYDNSNNDWIGCNGNDQEWAVAYHGVGNGAKKELSIAVKVKGITDKGLLYFPGSRQAYADCDDTRHGDQTVGNGVYLTPDINEAEEYAGIDKFSGDQDAKIVFMCRVNPLKIREPEKDGSPYWILNGTPDEIRPYRILLKKY